MKCEHCGYELIHDEDGWIHKNKPKLIPEYEICYINKITELNYELLEAKERIKELENICNQGP